MTDNRNNDDLRTWLRNGDPAQGTSEPSPDRVARMRRRVTAEAQAASPRVRYLGALAAAAAVLALLLLMRPEPPVTTGSGAIVESAADSESESAARRIHFVTEGGTRVVWTLDPDFDL